MSTHNLCFELKYEKSYLKIFSFFLGIFSIYLSMHVFVMAQRRLRSDCAYTGHSVDSQLSHASPGGHRIH